MGWRRDILARSLGLISSELFTLNFSISAPKTRTNAQEIRCFGADLNGDFLIECISNKIAYFTLCFHCMPTTLRLFPLSPIAASFTLMGFKKADTPGEASAQNSVAKTDKATVVRKAVAAPTSAKLDLWKPIAPYVAGNYSASCPPRGTRQVHRLCLSRLRSMPMRHESTCCRRSRLQCLRLRGRSFGGKPTCAACAPARSADDQRLPPSDSARGQGCPWATRRGATSLIVPSTVR